MNIVYAMGIGFLLDCMLGDPHNLPHPIRWIGRLIAFLDRQLHLRWMQAEKENRETEAASCGRKINSGVQIFCGILLVAFLLAATGGIVFAIRYFVYQLPSIAGIVTDGILFYYCIAPRSLYTESMAVYEALPEAESHGEAAAGTIRLPADSCPSGSCQETLLQEARRRLSMIVGRDTEALPKDGIIRAAVETVAENTSDGVTAPMLYMALGGPVLCFLYKAVNTMDSMVGYHNESYEYFGKAAARMDDVWNYIPSRLSAYAMAAGAFLLGLVKKLEETDASPDQKTALLDGMDWKRGLRIYKRDRKKHKSPNSAQTESMCAGVLGVRLAGDASYFGKTVHKPYIGDAVRGIEKEDIRRAGYLMYAAAGITLLLLMELRLLWYVLL